MINLEFVDADGKRVAMRHDVHPASQEQAIVIPPGARAVIIWLGTRSDGGHDDLG